MIGADLHLFIKRTADKLENHNKKHFRKTFFPAQQKFMTYFQFGVLALVDLTKII